MYVCVYIYIYRLLAWRVSKRKVYVSKSDHYTGVRFGLLQWKTLKIILLTATCFIRFQCWLSSLHDTYLLTYLLSPWCRVLLEKLTGLQLVKKFPAFHGTPRFITALTSVRHLSLSWANPIQSTYPHPTSWRSILILSTHLRLGLPSGGQNTHCIC